MTSTAAMIGAGLIGRSWAMVFARAGWQVRLYDSDAAQLDAAREHIAGGTRRAAGVRTRRRRRSGGGPHRLRRGSRSSTGRRGMGAGERARSARREARAVSAHRSRDAGRPRSSPARRRRSPRPGSPRILPDARAAWSRIRSIRRISCRWSSCAVRRGRRRRRWSARAR